MNKQKIIHPNGYACDGCIYWDPVNGCWKDYTRWCGKDPLAYEEEPWEEDHGSEKEALKE
ncbi:hypothetical protein ES702_01812 [subsurface metagenome]